MQPDGTTASPTSPSTAATPPASTPQPAAPTVSAVPASTGASGTQMLGMSQAPAGAPATGTASTAAPSGALPPGSASPFSSMMPLLLIGGLFVVMIIFSSRAGAKERKKRAEMISSIGTNDRVQTIGGVIGVVTEVKDDEVTLMVDEATKTRIRFSKGAVSAVLRKANQPASGSTTEAKPSSSKAMV